MKPLFLNIPSKPLYLTVLVMLVAMLMAIIISVGLPEPAAPSEPTDFERYYRPVGEGLAENGVFRDRNGAVPTQYPPGYSLIVAFIWKIAALLDLPPMNLLDAFLILCTGLTAGAIFLTTHLLWRNWGAILVAGAWIFYPFHLWLLRQPSVEIPFMTAFYGGWLLFAHTLIQKRYSAWRFWLIGILFGGAMLIRPIAVAMGIVIVAIMWLTVQAQTPRQRLLYSGLVLLGNLMMVLPWQLWVYSQTQQVILLSDNASASISDGLTYAVNNPADAPNFHVPDHIHEFQARIFAQAPPPNSDHVVSVFWQEFQADPIAGLHLLLIKITRVWYGSDSGKLDRVGLAIQLPFLLIYSVALWRLWQARQNQRFLLSSVLVVLYFWGMASLVLSIVRYMTPIAGIMLMAIPALWIPRESKK